MRTFYLLAEILGYGVGVHAVDGDAMACVFECPLDVLCMHKSRQFLTRQHGHKNFVVQFIECDCAGSCSLY